MFAVRCSAAAVRIRLTGSERIKKTQAAAGFAGDANYEQLRESSCINKSLSFLEQVVNALARGDAHVPFRWVSVWAAASALQGVTHTCPSGACPGCSVCTAGGDAHVPFRWVTHGV